jgi:preprotein translocase subunit SecA
MDAPPAPDLPAPFLGGQLMQSAPLLPRPGVRFGPYPERDAAPEPGMRLAGAAWRGWLHAPALPSARRCRHFLRAVHAAREQMLPVEAPLLAAQTRHVRAQLAAEGFSDQGVARAFGVVAAAMQRGLHCQPYDTQCLAAWWLLERRLVEMQTGEGKTLAIAMAALAAALAGIPVHVVTANDYLVERDAANLAPVAALLGLRVGHVLANMAPAARRHAFEADITYVTGRELIFDYLRDRLGVERAGRGEGNEAGNRLLRGLCMAIVDEADSLLLDEARVPFVLSEAQDKPGEAAFLRQSLFLAAQLRADEDYVLHPGRNAVSLTSGGRVRAETLGERVGGAWLSRFLREETLCLALAARHLYQRDRHYLVRDDQVLIIDENTGRSAPGRQWSRGLHQMIEAKENCPLSAQTGTAAQLSFQRFFPRYLRLSGISGTLMEARRELLAVYGLPVAQVPLRVPSRRRHLGRHAFADTPALWAHVAERARSLRAQNRPCLIGTDSVAASHELSAVLSSAGLAHTVLNAKQDADEAAVVAAAGHAGTITIATNMAGRGTDIALTPEAAAAGGLHVISCQINPSRRIDRQLFGRCARQGLPGSVEQAVALDGAAHGGAALDGARWIKRLLSRSNEQGSGRGPVHWAAQQLMDNAQRRRERDETLARWALFLADHQLDRLLAIAGPRE